MSNKTVDAFFGGLLVGVILVAAVFAFVVQQEKYSSYQQGYCAALGGVVLGDSCNVDGKVVQIVRD